MKPTIALIGPGKVGCAIGRLLHLAGYQLTAVISRDKQRAIEACNFISCSSELGSDQLADAESANILMLAVPDDQIKSLTIALSPYL